MTIARRSLWSLLFLVILPALGVAQPDAPLDTVRGALESLERPPVDMEAAVRRVTADLANERVTGFDGRSTSLLSKLETLPTGVLDATQKTRITRVLAEIYEMNLRLESGIPANAPGKGYQLINWQHTRTEVNEVLDFILKHNARALRSGGPLIPAAQVEQAILAAAFSDSVKLPPGPNGNFFNHHLDGAEAAKRVLARYYRGTSPALTDIVRAIEEHQIVPPGFMGKLARGAMFGRERGALLSAVSAQHPDAVVNGQPNPNTAQGRTLKTIVDALDRATDVDPARRAPLALDAEQSALLRAAGRNADDLSTWSRNVNGAQDRIASPLTQARTANGSRIRFTRGEQSVLGGVGIREWIVPQSGARHATISEYVRVGDTAANYTSSPAGVAKIVGIRGPGTPFADRTVWDSIRSARDSFDDALRVLPPEHHPVLRDMQGRTILSVRDTGREVGAWIKANKGAAGYRADEPVLFWSRKATTEGLAPEQVAARTEFAKQIRAQVEKGLRARQESWANVGRAPYPVDDIATAMRARRAIASPAAVTNVTALATNPGAVSQGAPVVSAASSEGTVLGIRMGGINRFAGNVGKGTAIGAAVGVGIEAGRELLVDGRVDPATLWRNTFGNIQEFWKPLVGGTAGALAAGALAARFLPGGRLIATGAQFLGGSLGASAATGQLARDPGRALAGAVGSTAGAIAGGAALAWLFPPFGSAVGSIAGGVAGQALGEYVYGAFKGPAAPVAAPVAAAAAVSRGA